MFKDQYEYLLLGILYGVLFNMLLSVVAFVLYYGFDYIVDLRNIFPEFSENMNAFVLRDDFYANGLFREGGHFARFLLVVYPLNRIVLRKKKIIFNVLYYLGLVFRYYIPVPQPLFFWH